MSQRTEGGGGLPLGITFIDWMRSLHFGGNGLLPSRWQWYNEEVIASSNAAAAPYQRATMVVHLVYGNSRKMKQCSLCYSFMKIWKTGVQLAPHVINPDMLFQRLLGSLGIGCAVS